MGFSTVLFDLDGTLTDPWEGITRCVQHALASFGIEAKQEELTTFIGPPLVESFETRYGFSSEDAFRAVEVYRERFASVGMFENELFDGIPSLLAELRSAGMRLAVATSKPEEFARPIVEHFGLGRYFDIVAGSQAERMRMTKTDVILDALGRLGSPDLSDVVMVGDRKHDLIGAREAGIPAIGVAWGYAPEGELASYGPIGIADTVDELRGMLLSDSSRG